MQRSRVLAALLLGALTVPGRSDAGEGPFVGVDIGASLPTNRNYQAEVKAGGTVNPHAGYLFDLKGLQVGPEGELQFTFQSTDRDFENRSFDGQGQWTSLAGYLGGLRAQFVLNDIVPLKDYIPYWERLEPHADFLGGGYSGLSGRMKHTAAGFSLGGGLDFYITENFAIGAFGRYNRTYQAPRPTFLANQVPEEQGPADARWATFGLAVTYRWIKEEAPVVPPPVLPPPVVAKKKIILRNVNFDFDKSNIRPDATPILDEAVRLLKEEGEVTIVCKGYTDSIGSAAYNQGLSLRRANAVKAYLVDHGIPAKRITVQGFGKSDPVASNETADGRAQNRRVELHVSP
jgi:outer membrane protein OmpA-like peptidoglycan-associated protein